MNEHSEVFMIMGRSGIGLPQFNVHRCNQELWANSAESKSLSSTHLTRPLQLEEVPREWESSQATPESTREAHTRVAAYKGR